MATILVADDDEPGRRYVTSLLASQGHRVLEAGDGVTGLDMVERERPDLVFTDLLMPGLDGYELANEIRGRLGDLDVPIIFYSATYQEAEGRALAAQLGARVVVKPAEPQTILRHVARALGPTSRTTRRRTRPRRDLFAAEHRRVVANKLAKKASELETVRRRLDAMLRLATEAGQAADPLAMIQILCDGAREIIPSRVAGILIGGRDGATADHFIASGYADDELLALGEHAGFGQLAGRVARGSQPARGAAQGKPGGRQRSAIFPHHPRSESWMVVPIPFRSHRGVLYLADRLGGRRFDPADERMAVALAAHLATAYETHRLLADLQTTVTRLEESQHRLEISERLFRMVLEASPDAIIGVDEAGRITYANPQVAQAFGYAGAELLGEPIERLVPEMVTDHGARRAAYMAAAQARPMGLGLDLTARRRDGSVFPVEISLSPVETREGLTVFATVTDITMRQALAAKMLQAERMESIGQLAGGVAHDFNNLLTVIGWYDELLQADIPPDDPRREYVDGIARAAERAATLTQQLLAFGRRQMLEVEPIDLNSRIMDVAPMLGRVAGGHVEFVLDLGDDLPEALFDASRLEQVLVNLTINARDAMPRGGRLIVATSTARVDEAFAGRHGVEITPGTYDVLAVSDTGSGMDQATQARIFEPFFTTKGPGKGTGLGLSSVYGIVKQSDGFIWVYSELGLGTTFKIYIPQAHAARQPVEPPIPAAPSLAGSGTVLLVEDDPDIRLLTVRALHRQGFDVEAASTPAEALERFERDPGAIDLLVTDVVMPGMSGPDLAVAVRSIRHIPVLFMSGYSGDDHRHPDFTAADSDFLEKPFSAAALVSRAVALLAPAQGSRKGPARMKKGPSR